MAGGLRSLVATLSVALAWAYCRDNAVQTSEPTTTLTYYKNPMDTTKSVYGKCKSGGVIIGGPPMESSSLGGFDFSVAISSNVTKGEQTPGYELDDAQGLLIYDTAKIPPTLDNINSVLASVSMYPHPGYACAQFTDIAGNNVSLAGTLQVTIKLSSSNFFPDGMAEFLDTDDGTVTMTQSYDVAGRVGPQIISLSLSLEPKMATKGNLKEIKFVYGATARILLHPFNGDPTSRLSPDNMPKLAGIEFFLPRADKPAPMAPSLKQIGYNFLKLIFPKYDLGLYRVDMWNYTFAPAGSDLYACVERAEPGKELVIDGLMPSTAYRFLARSTIPPVDMWSNATSNSYSFDMMTGSRGGSAGDVRFVSVAGRPETFRKDNTTAVVRIPAALSRGNPRIAQADVRFQDPLTNREFRTLSFASGGVFEVPNLNMKAGFKVKYTLTDSVGFVSAFNESMLLYTNESKPGAGAAQLNADPLSIGPPVVLRTGARSLLLRLPVKVSGYAAPVAYGNISLADAVSGVLLLPSKRRANASVAVDNGLDLDLPAKGSDTYIGNLPPAPSMSYQATVVTVDESGAKSYFSSILNPTDPHRPHTLGVRVSADHHTPAFQLAGTRLELSTPRVAKKRVGKTWQSYSVARTVYNATNALTGALLGSVELKAGGGGGISVPAGTPVVLVTNTYTERMNEPVLTTVDVIVRDPLDELHTNTTTPSLMRISGSVGVLRLPHLLAALQTPAGEGPVPVNELTPVDAFRWRVVSLADMPTNTIAEATAALEATELLEETLEVGEDLPEAGMGVATVGEALLTGLPPPTAMYNIKVDMALDNGQKHSFAVVPPVPPPLTGPLVSEPTAPVVTTHIKADGAEMKRVAVVRLPARHYVSGLDAVTVAIYATRLEDDTTLMADVACGCVDTRGVRVTGMEPACGADQAPPPCDDGVELECPSPYQIRCGVKNSTEAARALAGMLVVEKTLPVADVATDHTIKMDRKWRLVEGLTLTTIIAPPAAAPSNGTNETDAAAPEAAKTRLILAHAHARVHAHAHAHQAGGGNGSRAVVPDEPAGPGEGEPAELYTGPVDVACDPNRRLQELLELPTFRPEVVGRVEFLPVCGGLVVRVPPMVKPTVGVRVPAPADYVMDYNITVFNMGLNGTSGVELYRKQQRTACGATEQPLKGCGLAAVALPINVTSKVVVHLNLSDWPEDSPVQAFTAFVPPPGARAPYLAPAAPAPWKGTADMSALAGVGLYPSARYTGPVAAKLQAVGVAVRLQGATETAMVMKNVNASVAAGDVSIFASGTGDSLVPLVEPAAMPRRSGTAGRMSLRMGVGGQNMTVGVTDQSLVEAAVSMQPLPKTAQGLPFAQRPPPGKPGVLATVLVPPGLQGADEGLVPCAEVVAVIAAVARDGGSVRDVAGMTTTAAAAVGAATELPIPEGVLNDSMWVVEVAVTATYGGDLKALRRHGQTRGRSDSATVVFRVTGSRGHAHHVAAVAAMPRVSASVAGTVRVDCPPRMIRYGMPVVSCTVRTHDVVDGRYNVTETVLPGGSVRLMLATGHTHNVTVTANPSSFQPRDALTTVQPVPYPALLTAPPLNASGPVGVIPLCPVVMIRLPKDVVNASGAAVGCVAGGGRWALTVKDTSLLIKLNEFGLHPAGDTVVPMPDNLCCNQTCRLLVKCISQTGRRTTVQDISIVAPPDVLISNPEEPKAYTNSCSAITIVNPRQQRVDYVVSSPDLPTKTGKVPTTGVFSVDGLEPATTYTVQLKTFKSTTLTQTKTMLCKGVSTTGVDPDTGALSFASDYTGQRPVVAIAPAMGGVGVNCPEAFGGRETKRCSVALRLSPSAAKAAEEARRRAAASTALVGVAAGVAQGDVPSPAECCAAAKAKVLRAEVQLEFAAKLEDGLNLIDEGGMPLNSGSMTELLPARDGQFAMTSEEVSRSLPTPTLGNGPGQYASQEELDVATRAVEWARTALAGLSPGAQMPMPPVVVAPDLPAVEIVLKVVGTPTPEFLTNVRSGFAAQTGVAVDRIKVVVQAVGLRGGALNMVDTQQAAGINDVVVTVTYETDAEANSGVMGLSADAVNELVSQSDGIEVVSVGEPAKTVAPASQSAFGSQEEAEAAVQAVLKALFTGRTRTDALATVDRRLASGGQEPAQAAADSSAYVDGPMTDLNSVMLVGDVANVAVVNSTHDFDMDYELGDIATDAEAPRPLPVIKDMSDKRADGQAGPLDVTVTVTNLDGVTHKFTTSLTPFTNLPQSGDSRPYVVVKRHDMVELQMQADLLQTDYTFMRIAYESLDQNTPMVVYPYLPDTTGGDGSLNLDPYVMGMAAGRRYRLVAMLRRPDATYHNWCLIVTADRDPARPPAVPTAVSVTSDSITLALPSFSGLQRYQISAVGFTDRGDEERFLMFDGRLDELSRYGDHTGPGEAFAFTARGLAPGTAHRYAVQTVYNDGRADKIVMIDAITDTTAFECLVGRSNRVQAPVAKAGTIRSRNFSVEFEEIMTFETPRKYPVSNMTVMLKYLGYCPTEDACEVPHAPWEPVARQVSIEDLDEGVNITGITAAGQSQVRGSCLEVVSSGFFDMKPKGYKGRKFTVYCDVQEDGVWAKVMQADTSYMPTKEAFGTLSRKGNVEASGKLSDAQIGALEKTKKGNRLWRIQHSGSGLKLYIKTKADYNDTLPSFGFLEDAPNARPSTYGAVLPVYSKRGPWAKFEYGYIDTKATTPMKLTGDSCDRMIMGKGSFDCFRRTNVSNTAPARCLNGGLDCDSYQLLQNVEMFLFQGSGCPKQCSGHGTCVAGACRCAEGWEGKACDEPVANSRAVHVGHARTAALIQTITPAKPHRVGLWDFAAGTNLDPSVVQEAEEAGAVSLLQLQVGAAAGQVEEERGRLLEAAMVGLRPGSSYQVSVTAFNAWGESDVGFPSRQIQLDSEPPNAVDMPFFGDEAVGDPSRKTPRRPTVPMSWRAPYHNGAPVTTYVVECTPPMPRVDPDDGSTDATIYPDTPGRSWSQVYVGNPPPDAVNPKMRSITLGADTLPNATLVPATLYQCRVKACNGPLNGTRPTRCGGFGEKAQFRLQNEAPEMPDEPELLDFTVSTAKLSWRKPRHNGAPVLHYELRYRTYDYLPLGDGSPCGKAWQWSKANASNECPNTTDTKCDETGLIPGKRYFFQVRAVNCVGKSRWSPAVKVHTPGDLPDPPIEMSVPYATPFSLTVQFLAGLEDNGAMMEGYEAEVDNYTHSMTCDSSCTAVHCLSLTTEQGGEAGNLLTWPWCLPSGDSMWNEGGYMDHEEAMRPYGCETAVSERYVNMRIDGLQPATTYRIRVRAKSDVGYTDWSKDYSKVLYQDEFRQFTVGRTMDYTPDPPKTQGTTPIVARTNFTDEFERMWGGLCNAAQGLQGACPGCVKRTLSCDFPNGTVDTKGCYEECKQICRDLDQTVGTTCYGMAFGVEDHLSPNCIVSTYDGGSDGEPPLSPSDIAYPGWDCFAHRPQNLTGVYDVDNNTYSFTITWEDTRDPEGQPVIDYRLMTQNVTRHFSSSTPKISRSTETTVDYERLAEIHNIDAINFRMQQPYNTTVNSTGLVNTYDVGGFTPDTEYNVAIAPLNAVGLNNPFEAVRFKTGPGRPESPRAPTLSSKSGFFMRVRCEEPVGLDGGSKTLGFTMQFTVVDTSDPDRDDDDIDWTGAAEEEYTYGRRYTFGALVADLPVTVGCLTPASLTDDPFPDCLELASKYAFRCKLRNELGYSSYSDSSTFGTAGGPPDSLPRRLLKRDVQPDLYRTGLGFKFGMEMPAGNGMPLQFCDLEIGGTWAEEAPVTVPGAAGCTTDVCPRVRKSYRKQAPGFEIADEFKKGYRHFRLQVRHSKNTRWCIGGFVIRDVRLKDAVPERCSAFQNRADPVCAGLEYCSNEGYTTGWVELHFEKNVDPFSYVVAAPADPSTLPSHVELHISKTGNADSYRMVHTAVLNVTDPAAPTFKLAGANASNASSAPLPPAWPAQEMELEKPSPITYDSHLSLVEADDLTTGNTTHPPFLGYVDDDGWLLVLSYSHDAQRRPLNPVSLPVDPADDFAHASLAMLGLTERDVAGVRMQCTSSRHERVLHYTTTNTAVVSAVVRGDNATGKYMQRPVNGTRAHRRAVVGMGDFDGNVSDGWYRNASMMPDHTARLPLAANIFSMGAGLWNTPFAYEAERYSNRTGETTIRVVAAWSIGGNGTRWECDDVEAPQNGTDAPKHDGARTNHAVWVKLRSAEYEPWVPSPYETTCVPRPIQGVERLAGWEVVDSGADLDVELSKGNTTFKSVLLTAQGFGLRAPDTFGIVKKVRTDPGQLYSLSVLARTIVNDRPGSSVGAITAVDKRGNSLLKGDAGETLPGVFFDDSGKRAVATFEATGTQTTFGVVFKNKDDSNTLTPGDQINVTMVTLMRSCKEEAPGLYIPPESCGRWARLFSTNATGGEIPAKPEVANLWSASNKILKVTQNYDGTGDKIYLQDQLPSFIADPLYAPSTLYKSQDRDQVQCAVYEKWHLVKSYARQWDPSDPNVVASATWSLWDAGVSVANFTNVSSEVDMSPCHTQGQSTDEGVPLTTWFMCADEAADFTVDPPKVPDCIDNNHVAIYTKNPGVCGAEDHPTLVTLVGQPCEGEPSKVQYNTLHVVDPAPWCNLSDGLAVTSFIRSNYQDPSDRPGLYHGVRHSYLGSPGRDAGGTLTACGTPPGLGRDLPSTACAVVGSDAGGLTFVVPDVAAPQLPYPVPPVLDSEPGECVRYCEASSEPECNHMCDESIRTRATLPMMPYYFRARCFNQAGFGDWGPWQRHVSSVGRPSQPLNPQLGGQPTHTSQMVMWDPSQFHNNPYAAGFPMAYYEVSYMCTEGIGCLKRNLAPPPADLTDEQLWERSQKLWKEESLTGCRSECDEEGICRNCTVHCLVPHTTYEFRVRAFNGGGYSTFTNDTLTTLTAMTRPSVPLRFDKMRGDVQSGGKWTSAALKHTLAKYLNATCPTPDAYSQNTRMVTTPRTADTFQQPPADDAAACTVEPGTFTLTASWMMPEVDFGSPIVMYRISASTAPTWRYPQGLQIGEVPPFGKSPYTFVATSQAGQEALNYNETLTRVAPSDRITVTAQAINLVNGVQMASDHAIMCTITAPPSDPCWDGWNNVLGACLEVHFDNQMTPKMVTSMRNGLQVALPAPLAQNRGTEPENVYQVQWKWQDVYQDQADLCLTPEERNSTECRNVKDRMIRAADLPRDDEGYRLLNLSRKDGINVQQGNEEGQMYDARVRIQTQCDEETMDKRVFELQLADDSGYMSECTLYPTPDPQPNPNRPSPTPKAFAVGEQVFTDRRSIVFTQVPDELNFDRSYVLRCPYSKQDRGFEMGGAIKLKSSTPVAVYASTRMAGPEPDARVHCSEFKYPGFRPTNQTCKAQTRSGGSMDFDYQLKRRAFTEPAMDGGRQIYPVEFNYEVDPEITQHPTGLGFNETKCTFADSYSFFLITPLTGTEGCPWTRWTRWSEPMETKSLCPYSQGGKCGGTALDGSTRGVCNETTGRCKCHAPEAGRPTYGGPACEVEVEEAMCKCVGDPHCTTADGQYFDYSGGGEMRMYHNRFRPEESINVVLTKVGAVTAIGKVAFKYGDRIITVESHPEGETSVPDPRALQQVDDPFVRNGSNGSNGSSGSNGSNSSEPGATAAATTCPTLRINCNATRVVEEDNLAADPIFSARLVNRSDGGLPEPLEILTENPPGENNRFCDGNEGQFTIINHDTHTRLQCLRWGGEYKGYFHCYLRYYRDKNRVRGKPLESGLCSYNGSRAARFEETMFEDLVRVDYPESLFLATNQNQSKDGYCVSQTKFCGDLKKWDKKPTVQCHSMDGEFFLQSEVEVNGQSRSVAADRPHLQPHHNHVTAATAAAGSGVLSPRLRSLGAASLLEVAATTAAGRQHHFAQSSSLFDTDSAAQHDALASHMASRAVNVGRGVVSAAAPGHSMVHEDVAAVRDLQPQGLVQTAAAAVLPRKAAPSPAEAEAEAGGAAWRREEAVQATAHVQVGAAAGQDSDVDCAGEYGECDANCKKVYHITTQQSGGGSFCPAFEGDIADCSCGEGLCPACPSSEPKMEDVECPETTACTEESCRNAKVQCFSAFTREGISTFSAYAGCLADVCIKAPPGTDQSAARFWVNQAIQDARITTMYGDLQAQYKTEVQEKSDEEKIAETVPSGGRCPDYSYGTEIWNSNRYRQTVASWDSARLVSLCCPDGQVTDDTPFTPECIAYKPFCQLVQQQSD